MSFKSVFIAIVIGTSLILTAIMINRARPARDTDRSSAQQVRATGRCAECHREETSAVVHQFEMSQHAQAGVTCLDCHQSLDAQQPLDHQGFVMAQEVTSLNCQRCHATEYRQFARSRHALPAWTAVNGAAGLTAEQIAFGEQYHAGAVDRAPNPLATLEGSEAIITGCLGCHDVGKPNDDGSVGSCTHCHSRHSTSIALAREPQTCGQCHMGPDHAQIEIYNESKHGVMFNAQRASMNLNADPKLLTTRDMPIPTCSTCHMSGLEGLNVTHDTTERLSYWLFAPVSERRPTYAQGRAQMRETCLKCHAAGSVERFFQEAEAVLAATNDRVREGEAVMAALREDSLLTPEPFDEPLEFLYFDFWHYFGRTAKHGAFMGGADFVQWHGNYELLLKLTEIRELAGQLREDRGSQ